VKFRFMAEHRERFRIRKLCEVLDVSRSGFYAWLHRQPSRRERENEAIAVHVREVHRQSREIYGSPRIYAELRDEGKGFDPATVPDPCDAKNLARLSGRGLMLIRTFMDEVRFSERGNELTMVKRRRAG